MKQIIENGLTVIIADSGKVFRRKGDTFIYGDKIYLGYSSYINGIKLKERHKDVPDDFEEIEGGNE